MKILILGAGAVGGYFGARMMQKGIQVTFLVREKRAERLRTYGLRVQSPLGDIEVHPKIITELRQTDVFDLAIISCKSYSLQNAMSSLALLPRNTYILPLLNGLSHYTTLIERFGKHWVLGGFADLSVVLNEEGLIQHLNNSHRLALGAMHPDQRPFVSYLDKELHSLPFIKVSENIQYHIWKKLVFIATVASATCLMDASIGDIVKTPAGPAQISRSFEMNCNAAAFAGYEPDEEWRENILKKLLDPSSTLTASLLRAMRSGLPAEISMVEDMLIANRKAGIDNGLLEAAYCRLQLYERQRTPSDDKQEILNSQSLDKRTTKNEYNNSRQIPLAGGAS